MRMKTNTSTVSKICLALLAFSGLSVVAQAEPKIAIIDLQRVFTNYWKTVQANAQIEDQKTDIRKRTQSMADDYAKAKQDYKKLIESASDQAVSDNERDKRK